MSNPILLPEWSPIRAVLLAWPFPGGPWQSNYTQAEACYWALLQALSLEVEVWVLLHHSLDPRSMQIHADSLEVDATRVKWVTGTDYDDTWIRDYGPLSTSLGYISFTFNGWGGKYCADNDNKVPQNLAPLLGSEVHEYAFVCEGGGLETDGTTLLLNADCIVDDKRNPGLDRRVVGTTLLSYLGATDIEWLQGLCLTGDDTDGHIDTMARFVKPSWVVYTGRNPDHPDSEALQTLHQQLSSIAVRRSWTLFELPTPLVYSAVDGRQLPATYANFLIVNDCVFVPIYGHASDLEALQILARACPGKRITGVRCEALLEQHGSLHCATMQVAEVER